MKKIGGFAIGSGALVLALWAFDASGSRYFSYQVGLLRVWSNLDSRARVQINHSGFRRYNPAASWKVWNRRLSVCFRWKPKGRKARLRRCTSGRHMRLSSRGRWRFGVFCLWQPKSFTCAQLPRRSPRFSTRRARNPRLMKANEEFYKRLAGSLRRKLSFPGQWPRRRLQRCLRKTKLSLVYDASGKLMIKELSITGSPSISCRRELLKAVVSTQIFPSSSQDRRGVRVVIQGLGLRNANR